MISPAPRQVIHVHLARTAIARASRNTFEIGLTPRNNRFTTTVAAVVSKEMCRAQEERGKGPSCAVHRHDRSHSFSCIDVTSTPSTDLQRYRERETLLSKHTSQCLLSLHRLFAVRASSHFRSPSLRRPLPCLCMCRFSFVCEQL